MDGAGDGERKRVVLAEPRGFCAGVRRAIAMTERALEVHGAPVYVRKQIVHNHHVVGVLERKGARFVDSEAEVPDGAVCVLSAHGVAPAVREAARASRLRVVDATCPLVARVHQHARRTTRDGRLLLLIGHADHEETVGTSGEAPDRTIVVETVADVDALGLPDDTPVSYLTQTTLSVDDTAAVVARIRARFHDVDEPGGDTICYASQNRQTGVKSLAARTDLVLVVGSENSSNSQRMVDVARGAGVRSHLVPDVGHLVPQWWDGVRSIGVSSGASVPDLLVEQVLAVLAEHGFDDVVIDTTAVEDVVFAMPAGLRAPEPPPPSPPPSAPPPSPPSLLAGIRGPADVRALPEESLPALADELRALLVEHVPRTGGHLGPSLGVVELTIALHRVFDSPRDTLLWDTGHQAYVHKALTGRQDFSGLRRRGGLSGYPSRAESVHDVVENSHASTALSYAYGTAVARTVQGARDRHVVAVVGDGSLTGGMAWEALNTIGGERRRVVVVLNDNGRSYAPTVGGLADHLALLRRDGPGAGTVFEAMGLEYLGPVDGHDVAAVTAALREAADVDGPVVVHCTTSKGRGHPPAEADEVDRFHAVRAAPAPGAAPSGPSWTSVFGRELVRLGEERDDVVALSAAMVDPTGLTPFAQRFPDRVLDVGIAEQHAVAAAAGLALAGVRPVLAVYATFLTRALDQVLMDVALHRCPVVIVLDRAGLTGDDGASHNGVWDLALLGVVPGLRVAAPRDGATLRAALRAAVRRADGPSVLRFPKGSVGPDVPAVLRCAGVDVLRTDRADDVLLVAVGPMAGTALAAARLLADRGLGVTVVDPRWLMPVPAALTGMAARFGVVATVEDGVRTGGFGSALAQALRDAAVPTPVVDAGVPRRFLDHGTRAEVLAECGLTPDGVAGRVLDHLHASAVPW